MLKDMRDTGGILWHCLESYTEAVLFVIPADMHVRGAGFLVNEFVKNGLNFGQGNRSYQFETRMDLPGLKAWI
jgi:hypothetical protein